MEHTKYIIISIYSILLCFYTFRMFQSLLRDILESEYIYMRIFYETLKYVINYTHSTFLPF